MNQELSNLASRLVDHGRPLVHAFSRLGAGYIYDVSSGAVFSASDEVLDLLSSLTLNTASSLTNDALSSVCADIEALLELGFFKARGAYRSPNELANALAHQPSRTLQVLVQTSCNLKCTYCYEVESGFHASGKRMTVEMGRRAVDLMFRRAEGRSHAEIIFFGGDPLLNFKVIKQLVAYAEDVGSARSQPVVFRLTTNGTLITAEIADYLVAKKIAVMVSIDGPAILADKHRVDHHGRGTTELAIKGALLLLHKQRAAGVRELMVRSTMASGNTDHDVIAKYFRDLGFRRTMIGVADKRLGQKDTSSDLSAEEHELGLLQFEDMASAYLSGLMISESRPRPDRIARSLQRVAKRLKTPDSGPSVGCGVGGNMLAATEDGSLYPCHRYAGEERYKMGTVDEGVNTERLTEYFRDVLAVQEQKCEVCWARVLCGGQCAWIGSNPNGEIQGPNEAWCDSMRASLEWLLAIHAQEVKLSNVVGRGRPHLQATENCDGE